VLWRLPDERTAGQLQAACADFVVNRERFVLTDSRVLREVPVMFAKLGMMLSKYWDSDRRRERLELLLKIRSERDMLLLPCEACQIMSAIKAVERVPGDMAELGVARGSSAKMISSSAPKRILHLFDTFEGLPKPSAEDGRRFHKGQYCFGLEDVQKYLRGRNVRFYKGLFPETAQGLSDTRFAFVHLDGDLYETTRAGLEWFYPRMSKGSILICHDFDTSVGVNRAFEEFFEDKPEPYIELTGCQCLFVKM
jgi:O-methyltransferase